MKESVQELEERFKDADPRDVIAWAARTYPGKTAVTTSFGADSACLLALLSEAAPGLPVLFVDTGFHFPETLAYRDRLMELLKLNLVTVSPAQSHEDFLKDCGPLYETDPDACCAANKVEPLKRAVKDLQCWMSGVRGGQTQYRQNMRKFETKEGGLLKVSPLLEWDARKVHAYITEKGLPRHPLWEKGYSSIGCEPCTALAGDEGDRSGRWRGKAKTECGIHTFLDRSKPS
jgi:phosphoadenosine phosphosulfate reductase